MNAQITPSDDDAMVSSRRRFLKQLTYGSLLALSGSDFASATVRHVYNSKSHDKKPAAHNTHASHHSHQATSSHVKHSHHSRQTLDTHSHHAKHPHPIAEHPKPASGDLSHKTIALHNINTGDKLNLTYFEHGRYIKDALQEINYLFRDYHTGTIHPVDPLLLDQLYDLKQHLDVSKPYHVISGYRSPLTNALLRSESYGVARHSLHMEGRAIDIRIEGLYTKRIRNAALAMRRGGVGYYPSANFVHLDTGEFRVW